MNIRNAIRTLAVAPVLAAAILSAPVEPVHAQPVAKNFSRALACELDGYIWSDTLQQCANKKCPLGGRNYEPGSVLTDTQGRRVICNGFTGEWVAALTQTPTGPAAPAGSGTVAPSGPTTTGPVGPRPTTTAR